MEQVYKHAKKTLKKIRLHDSQEIKAKKPDVLIKKLVRSNKFYEDIKNEIKSVNQNLWNVKIGASLDNSFIEKLSTAPPANDYVEILR